jgi:putative colanic acid biosynthesis glycosyltransferase WcaI
VAQTADVKILILNLTFPPDNVSTAHIVGRLAREFVERGHEVVVLTSTPHYHPEDVDDPHARLTPVVGPLVLRSGDHGLTAYHVWMPDKNRSLGWRLIAWCWFHLATFLFGLVVGRGASVIYTASPPLTMGCEARLLGLWHRIPYVYNVQEVHPDVAIALGAVTRPSFIRWLRRLEDWVYSRAKFVTVIGSGMRSNLVAKGVSDDKLVTITNFVDADELPIRPRNNAFAAAHGLVDRFVVSYAGNLGVPMGLTTVLAAAKLLGSCTEIAFVLIGDGSAAADLRRYAAEQQLTNVTFLPFQPDSAVPDIYATSDISIVAQASGTSLHGLPSKIYRIMACGRPIVGICEHSSEVAELIRHADCGVVVAPNDPAALAQTIKRAYDDRTAWNKKGAHGRQFVVEEFSVDKVADEYVMLLTRAAEG